MCFVAIVIAAIDPILGGSSGDGSGLVIPPTKAFAVLRPPPIVIIVRGRKRHDGITRAWRRPRPHRDRLEAEIWADMDGR
jgi:hypothetical protein